MSDERTGFAAACRKAGLAFMRGVALGWDATDLEMWRREHYGKLAIQPRDVFMMTPVRTSAAAVVTPLPDLLREARWKAFAALEEAATGHARFVQQVAAGRLIVRDVQLAWVPVDRRGTSLRGRVLSLFAVDCLVRLADYRSLLLACPRCESIVFDAEARAQGQCCGERGFGSGERASPVSGTSDPRRSVPAPSQSKERKH
jgi:hypothetical protein